ncbi:sulfatase [Rubellicoccus peritrichatus]|uniref:Sulfatase n=1 Tax=Rubellicoccus peritrichatus TaxID=3080537 RepID=A0AAQ3LDC8_9BACT|nr:sulfatase [Puniceicoccus sp. CR14]WOO43671.1 sulfatase [Puniceicoccus sp. CR14]
MSERPNLLFVFSDQHRACDLGCYGNDKVLSPNLDALAKGGALFRNFYSNSPLCVPARGTLLTGLHAMRHRAAGNDLPINEQCESLGAALQREGYLTGYIGKWHLGGVPRDQFIDKDRRLGFEEWYVANCNHNYNEGYYYDQDNQHHVIEGYEPIVQTDLAVNFIERNREKPWAAVLSWGPPHEPYLTAPKHQQDYYEEVEMSLRPNVPDRITTYGDQFLSRDEIPDLMRGYYAHITALDEQMGRLIDALKETDQLENTIIVYTSDHGDMVGSQGYMNKQLPYEESVNVPLIISWPGNIQPGERKGLASLVDLPVTLTHMVGASFKEKPDGRDFSAMLTDTEAPGAEYCYLYELTACHQSADRDTPAWRGLRTERYTFATLFDGTPWILYDNQEDPYQMNNLVTDPKHKSLVKELKKSLDCEVHLHDSYVSPEILIKDAGLLSEWNRSQAYFNRPLFADDSVQECHSNH